MQTEAIMRTYTGLTVALTLAVIGCSDGSSPGTEPGVALSFTAGTGPQAAPGFFASIMSDTLTVGGDELVLDKVEIVLREIELERVESDGCALEVPDDSCEEFEVGPVLLDLPLNGNVEQHVAIVVPAGSYDEVEFEIHKVSSDDPADAEFRATYPDMVGKSIRVRGSFNGQPFTYETDLDVEQEFDLMPPLEVLDGSGTTNVTVRFGVAQWFVDGAGNLVDPETGNKGGAAESLIKENIKQSIEAFEDDDRDGNDD
jgi:hypothetical protein